MAEKQNLILIITFYRPFDSFVSKNEGMTEASPDLAAATRKYLHRGAKPSMITSGRHYLTRRLETDDYHLLHSAVRNASPRAG